ncbi:hypothetical protein F5X98DRAFT_389216 [Xylaria grammica]|nr:hypothetical protein F5X98DRAFT_389216 [Xylaria grammica]
MPMLSKGGRGGRDRDTGPTTNPGGEGGELVISGSGNLAQLNRLLGNRSDISFTARLGTPSTSTSSTSASSSGKRSSTANDGPESKKKKKTEREAPAVPERSATEHLSEACPYRMKGPEDFRYLIFNRQRKPPVKSRMVLGKIIKAEVERAGSALSAKDEIELPYSSKYARQADRLNPLGGVRLPARGQPREGDPMTQQPSRRDVPPPIPTDLQHVPQRPVQGDSTRAIVTAQDTAAVFGERQIVERLSHQARAARRNAVSRVNFGRSRLVEAPKCCSTRQKEISLHRPCLVLRQTSAASEYRVLSDSYIRSDSTFAAIEHPELKSERWPREATFGPKGVICGRGRPAKGAGPSYYQARGLRAPKTKAAPQPAITMVTKSWVGPLERKNYCLCRRWAPYRGDGEDNSNEPTPDIGRFFDDELILGADRENRDRPEEERAGQERAGQYHERIRTHSLVNSDHTTSGGRCAL